MDGEELFILILHEFSHYLSFQKKGLKYHLEKLSSTEFDEFFDHVIHEEILADKIAGIMFYRFNGYIYNGKLKQNLHRENERSKYKTIARNHMFGIYSNNIEEYENAVEGFIFKNILYQK